MNQFGPPATSLIYRIDDPIITGQSQQAGHGTHTPAETTSNSSSSSGSGNKKRPASTSSSSSSAANGGGNQTGEGGSDPSSSAAKKKKTTSLDPTTTTSSTSQRPGNSGVSYNPNVLDESLSTLFSTSTPTAPPLALPQEDEECLVCGEGGMLILCDFPHCPRVYHKVLIHIFNWAINTLNIYL